MIRSPLRTGTASTALSGLLLVTAAKPGHAQSDLDRAPMRSFSTSRQYHGETRLLADLTYSAGTLRLAPGPVSDLYRMNLSYDDARFTPVSAYDASRGVASLGLAASGVAGFRVVSSGQLRQTATVFITPTADVALHLTLGAADADLELGGLRLSDLTLETGASRTRVRFSSPNGTRCRQAELTAGAAEVTVTGLGNSRCDELRFEGGVGSVTLDFGGAWSGDMRADLKMAMGRLTLRLPRGVGVRITANQTLASLDAPGLVAQRGALVTPGYDQAAHKLTISLAAALGGVGVEWIER